MVQLTWQEVAAGVMVRRHEDLDLNCGLVLGHERALVIDTATTTRRGYELAEAVRQVTPLEQVVVNTHAHYDHCFGNAAFRDSQIYAHVGAAEGLRRTAERQREDAMAHLSQENRHEDATSLRDTEVVLPFYLIESNISLDLGERTVHLLFGGRAHTDHDLAVSVPDAHTVFWGDLVEQGADPAMEDCYPLEWAATMHTLSTSSVVRNASVAVPGHGDVVDAAFVSAQTEQLRQLAACLQDGLAYRGRDVSTLMDRCRGLGLQDRTLRNAAVRTLETVAGRTEEGTPPNVPQRPSSDSDPDEG
ncbi:MAG: MBL fold metallo-hydrolase [Ornithinimicrobium sp.]